MSTIVVLNEPSIIADPLIRKVFFTYLTVTSSWALRDGRQRRNIRLAVHIAREIREFLNTRRAAYGAYRNDLAAKQGQTLTARR